MPKVKRHPKSTHAASTPATDGKHLVVLFGSEGLYNYDLNGKLLWKQDLGMLDSGWFYDPDYQWEYGSSPVIYKNLVIVQADIQKGSFIAAYDLKTGKQVWKTMREDELPGWGTPTVYEGKTRAELVTNGTKAIRGYDPLTGKELWRLTPNSEITTPTPIFAHDLIYVTSGYRPIQPIYAIRPGATGDITLKDGKESSEFIAWSKARGGPYMPTPIIYGDLLYTLSNQGVVTAYNAKTRRARLPAAHRRPRRRVHRLARRLRRQDLPFERGRRGLRLQGGAEARAALGQPDGRSPDGDARHQRRHAHRPRHQPRLRRRRARRRARRSQK